MIAMRTVHSTGSLSVVLILTLLLGGCVAYTGALGPDVERPAQTDGTFQMPDGIRLPYRAWLPQGPPGAVVLALHGMNDSRDAWEIPAPHFTEAGIVVFAPDQRGFGATAARGYWPGSDALAQDAAAMVRLLRARYPGTRLLLMGESMGAAVLMHLATLPDAPRVDGYILIAPAVWGRAEMNPLLRAALWTASQLFPGYELTGGVRVTASDNRAALIRLSTDPLTLHATRVDAVRGLVNLMDDALAAAPDFSAPALILYGGKDELIPPRAIAATWRGLPPDVVRRAFYPGGYHLLLRDLDRAGPIGDVLSWIANPAALLPTGADRAAAAWLAGQE
jgi:alpha-beta hydrolase superfamily lysophospholipase